MLSKITSAANVGLDAVPITVEVDISAQSMPNFIIVGLADRAVEESKERVRTSVKNSGADFPSDRIIVNLAPADLPKEGPIFDLAIALGVLKSSGQLEVHLDDTMVVGELSLDGGLRKTPGVLPLAILAKSMGLKKVLVPKENALEAAIVEGISVYAFNTLLEVFQFLTGSLKLEPEPLTILSLDEEFVYEYDFKDIKGQQQAKRALEIAAAGGHNIILKGPPGAGKTMLARAFPSILPSLTKEESLEVTKIYSICNNLPANSPIIQTRPFRSPHHTASYVGIVGGGNHIKPGEISLAHRGVLFLDELPEFPRQVLESLRQPLEDRVVTISRANGTLTFPSQFILLAAHNPCPCGYLGSLKKHCVCAPGQISRYKKKISGPLLDRIDIHLEVPEVDIDKLTSLEEAEDSKVVRTRVVKAREIQKQRFIDSNILTNSEMSSAQIKKFVQLDEEALELLKLAISQMNLSARAYSRVLKLSRTIADLSQSEQVLGEHIAEAITYRPREEN